MVNIHDPNVDVNILRTHRDKLKVGTSAYFFNRSCCVVRHIIFIIKVDCVYVQVLQRELLGREEEVRSLQQISSHILHLEQGEESMEAKEKVHVVNNKLHLLLRQVSYDLNTLKTTLVST